MNSNNSWSAYEGLPRRARRRALGFPLLRAAGVAGAVTVLYFTLPLAAKSAADTAATLSIGLLTVAVLLAWNAREVARSPYPQVRAVEALLTAFPIFVLFFATTYFVMGEADQANFSEAMTRIDALYFAVTVFSTVGFGDITAVTVAARIVVTVQMVLGVILVGLVAKVFYQSVQAGLARRDRVDDG